MDLSPTVVQGPGGGDVENGQVGTKSDKAPEFQRRLTTVALAFVTFFTISAGPFGLESAVRNGGALPALIAIATLTFAWGFPQACMTAEMSAMIDANGGPILWSGQALGDMAAWFTAFNSASSNLIDQALYPLLFASYVESQIEGGLSYGAVVGLKCAALFIMIMGNLRGIEDISRVSGLLAIIVFTPFILEIPIGWPEIFAGRANLLHSRDTIHVGLLTSTMLWNLSGWDRLGTLAGEVSDVGKTYPRGVALALVGIMLAYLIPVAVAVCIDGNTDDWQEGHFAIVAHRIAGWLGVWVAVGAACAQVGNGISMLAGASRMLWQMGHMGWLPRDVARISTTTQSPWVAVWVAALPAIPLMLLDFDTIISIDVMFNNVALLIEGASFLVLRYTMPSPETPRPFQVPGGLPFAWIITISKFGVIGLAFSTATPLAYIVVISANICIFAAYVVGYYYGPNPRRNRATYRAACVDFLGWPKTLRNCTGTCSSDDGDDTNTLVRQPGSPDMTMNTTSPDHSARDKEPLRTISLAQLNLDDDDDEGSADDEHDTLEQPNHPILSQIAPVVTTVDLEPLKDD